MIVMGIIIIGVCIFFWFVMKNFLDIYYGILKKFKVSYKVFSLWGLINYLVFIIL